MVVRDLFPDRAPRQVYTLFRILQAIARLKLPVHVIGLVGLGLILMSDRLRERSRGWIIRHFSRPHYNYQQIWSSFNQETGSFTTTETWCPELAKWISKTVNALSVTIWLVDETGRDLVLSGSTLDPDQPLPVTDAGDNTVWTVVVQSAIHLEEIVNLNQADGDPVECEGGMGRRP